MIIKSLIVTDTKHILLDNNYIKKTLQKSQTRNLLIDVIYLTYFIDYADEYMIFFYNGKEELIDKNEMKNVPFFSDLDLDSTIMFLTEKHMYENFVIINDVTKNIFLDEIRIHLSNSIERLNIYDKFSKLYYGLKSIDYETNEYIFTKNKKILDYEYELPFEHEEIRYLRSLKRIMLSEKRKSRNSITHSKFGTSLEFNIENSFPLLTTKKIFFKGVVKELLWFLKGQTDSKILEKDKVNIWKGNSTTEYLRSIGLDYDEGDCGPIYGFQWRHFNAPYVDCNTDYKDKGIDQFQKVIEQLKNNPTSRRILMTGWNPCQLDKMALPPCHVLYQFYVREENSKRYLDCQMYQRSGDMFLGVPFNIASTSLLTYIVSELVNLTPGKIKVIIGDSHIYENHIEQVEIQLKRNPYPFPTLEIKNFNSVEDITYEHLNLKNYNFHSTLKAEMIP